MTTLNTPPSPDLSGMQRKLTDRLARLGARIKMQIAFDALVRALAVVLALLTVSLVLDFWLELSRPIRVLYWLATLAAGAHFVYHYGVKPLRSKLGPIELAEALDVAQGNKGTRQIAPRVATVLQLPAMFAVDDQALSGQMIHDAVGRSYRSLEQTDFGAAANGKHVLLCAAILLAALVVPGAVGGVMSAVGEGVLSTWAQRWLLFSDSAYPRNTSIDVLGLDDDGKLVVPAGENFTLRTAIINKDETDVGDVRITLRPENGEKTTKAMDSFADNDFRLDMNPLTSPARATVSAGDQTFDFEIVPAARPRLTGIKLTHTHPADPGDKKTLDFNGAEGEVSLLELNNVELTLTANVKIAEMRYVKDENRDADAPALPPIQRVGPNAFKIAWTHKARQRFRVELVSAEAGLISQPIPISVGLKQDRKPSVRVRSTGVGPRITPNALIPLSEVKASDDYGLRHLKLEVLRERVGSDDAGKQTFDPIVLYQSKDALQKEVLDKVELEVDQFAVRPTDVLRITGVATDNRYTGLQTGESTTLTFRIVTHKELFREIIARQQQARAAFRQAIEDSRDLHAEIIKAQNGGQVAALDRRFRAVRRDVWKVSNELGKSAEEMRLNRLGGTKEEGNQAYESMKSTILDPLAKLHGQTMEQQLGAINTATGASAQQITQIADDQLALINEMNLLLSKMDRWDELLDAINQLSEVIDQQQQLKEKIDELIDEKFDDQFD
ncbi:MAG: hypothetical protein ACE37H_11755 [Phycisphaeraceae bacterium]